MEWWRHDDVTTFKPEKETLPAVSPVDLAEKFQAMNACTVSSLKKPELPSLFSPWIPLSSIPQTPNIARRS